MPSVYLCGPMVILGSKTQRATPKRYEWDIDGRKLCAIHWGTGIGSNDWKDADVVFLFDEFFIPRTYCDHHCARPQRTSSR